MIDFRTEPSTQYGQTKEWGKSVDSRQAQRTELTSLVLNPITFKQRGSAGVKTGLVDSALSWACLAGGRRPEASSAAKRLVEVTHD